MRTTRAVVFLGILFVLLPGCRKRADTRPPAPAVPVRVVVTARPLLPNQEAQAAAVAAFFQARFADLGLRPVETAAQADLWADVRYAVEPVGTATPQTQAVLTWKLHLWEPGSRLLAGFVDSQGHGGGARVPELRDGKLDPEDLKKKLLDRTLEGLAVTKRSPDSRPVVTYRDRDGGDRNGHLGGAWLRVAGSPTPAGRVCVEYGPGPGDGNGYLEPTLYQALHREGWAVVCDRAAADRVLRVDCTAGRGDGVYLGGTAHGMAPLSLSVRFRVTGGRDGPAPAFDDTVRAGSPASYRPGEGSLSAMTAENWRTAFLAGGFAKRLLAALGRADEKR